MPDERLEGHGPKHRRVGRDTPVVKAIRLMLDNHVGGLPLADDGKVVGILTEGDLFAPQRDQNRAAQGGLEVLMGPGGRRASRSGPAGRKAGENMTRDLDWVTADTPSTRSCG
jgi:CBS domain-containing protein